MAAIGGRLAVACGPALLTLYLAFNAGGFFVGAPGVVAAVLGIALVLRITIAEEPFAGLGTTVTIAAVSFGLLTAWMLASAIWSDAPAQAMIEFDRALMYWLALVFFGSFPREKRTLLWAVRAMAAALVVIAAVGLTTHLSPDLWEAPMSGVEADRLGYPLTYWNALGILCAVALILCAGLAVRRGEPVLSTVSASASVPVLATTLYLTFSRGGIAAALAGLLAFAFLARSRRVLSAALATLPPTCAALVAAYQSEALSTGEYADPAWISAGHALAIVVVACALAACLARLVLLRLLDPRLDRIAVAADTRRKVAAAAAAAAALSLFAFAVAVDAPARIGDQYDRFVNEGVGGGEDLRSRLTDVGNNGRLPQWSLAVDMFEARPLHGEGAGTFSRAWARDGTGELKVEDAHSLYLEVLAELGLVGLLLLAAGLIALFWGLARSLRARERAVPAALLVAGLIWVAHAGIDWDWEMPATALWLFALGGMAIARPVGTESNGLRSPGRIGRAALGIGCLALIVTPVSMALSQGELNGAVDALKEGDCRRASEDSLGAARLAPARPEPYQVLGYCNVRAGEGDLAIRMMEVAIARDPGLWSSYYGLALARGAAGKDPRLSARRALALNPYNPLAQDAVARFRTANPEQWRRRALSARLPIH